MRLSESSIDASVAFRSDSQVFASAEGAPPKDEMPSTIWTRSRSRSVPLFSTSMSSASARASAAYAEPEEKLRHVSASRRRLRSRVP